MEISIAEAARLTGTTSRALRHYHSLGLLVPSRIGPGGLRYYDRDALARLQRILLLRQAGVGLAVIAEVLGSGIGDAEALEAHLEQLRRQRHRLDRQICSVERTIAALREGRQIMAEDMLDGFDHTVHRDEVEQRWGASAYQRSDRWWRGLGDAGRRDFLAESQELARSWREAHEAGLPLDDARVADLAERHIAWIGTAWGGVRPTPEQVAGLAGMYVADERFAAHYGGAEGAAYVRDALLARIS